MINMNKFYNILV